MQMRLSEIRLGVIARIIRLEGGRGFQRRLRTRGLREGKLVSVVTIQPGGPLVVRASGTQVAIGRGIAERVIVEV